MFAFVGIRQKARHVIGRLLRIGRVALLWTALSVSELYLLRATQEVRLAAFKGLATLLARYSPLGQICLR